MGEESATEVAGAFLISDLTRVGSGLLYEVTSALFPTTLQSPVWIEDSALSDSNVVNLGRFKARHLREPLRGEVGTALAHRSAYESILRLEGNWWLILEDDAEILHGLALRKRISQIISSLRADYPTIVNLNHLAARKQAWSRRTDLPGLWRPFVPTYTATAYLVNREATRHLLQAQTPIQAQPDWPIDCREIMFLQESRPLVEPRSDLASVADPNGLRSRTPSMVKLQTWSWFWYLRNKDQFSGPAEYWHGVLLPRLMRHLHRSL